MSGVLEAEIQVLRIDLICSVSPFLLQAKHNGSNHEGPGVGVGGGAESPLMRVFTKVTALDLQSVCKVGGITLILQMGKLGLREVGDSPKAT